MGELKRMIVKESAQDANLLLTEADTQEAVNPSGNLPPREEAASSSNRMPGR